MYFFLLLGEINDENASKLLLRLENDIHLDYNPIQLKTIEIDLEKDLDEIMEESNKLIPKLDSGIFNHPGAGAFRKIPYDYLLRLLKFIRHTYSV